MLFVVYMNCSLSTSRNNIRTTPPLPSSSYHDPPYQDGIKKAKKLNSGIWPRSCCYDVMWPPTTVTAPAPLPSPPSPTASGWMCLESKYECIWCCLGCLGFIHQRQLFFFQVVHFFPASIGCPAIFTLLPHFIRFLFHSFSSSFYKSITTYSTKVLHVAIASSRGTQCKCTINRHIVVVVVAIHNAKSYSTQCQN